MSDQTRALKVKKIGLIIKHHQSEAALYAAQLTSRLIKKKIQVYFADESEMIAQGLIKSLKAKANEIRIISKEKLPESCDLIIVLGGDGTFLSIARLMRYQSIPIMGINMGQLGFLTEFRKEEALSEVDRLLDQKSAIIHERALLEVTLLRKNKIIVREPVINDAVISKGAIARIIGMELWIDGICLHQVRADGMITSTPTGSTAYALAAGGPIVDPSVQATIIAPICPHSLTLRPIVVPDSAEIKICLNDRPGHVLLTLDGQEAIDMKENDLVLIKKFKNHSVQLISSPSRDYFSLLRDKLKFGVRD